MRAHSRRGCARAFLGSGGAAAIRGSPRCPRLRRAFLPRLPPFTRRGRRGQCSSKRIPRLDHAAREVAFVDALAKRSRASPASSRSSTCSTSRRATQRSTRLGARPESSACGTTSRGSRRVSALQPAFVAWRPHVGARGLRVRPVRHGRPAPRGHRSSSSDARNASSCSTIAASPPSATTRTSHGRTASRAGVVHARRVQALRAVHRGARGPAHGGCDSRVRSIARDCFGSSATDLRKRLARRHARRRRARWRDDRRRDHRALDGDGAAGALRRQRTAHLRLSCLSMADSTTDAPSDRTAIVTGGGSGIGRAIAHAVRARAARTSAVVDIAGADATVGANNDERRRCARRHSATSGSRSDVAGRIRRVRARFGPLDVLVNSAGIAHVGTVESTRRRTSTASTR